MLDDPSMGNYPTTDIGDKGLLAGTKWKFEKVVGREVVNDFGCILSRYFNYERVGEPGDIARNCGNDCWGLLIVKCRCTRSSE